MATIKSYTDIEQSKKLAKILPTDSADMCYRYYSGGMITGYGDCVLAKSFITRKNVIRENDLPCWSLAALLGILDFPSLTQNKEDEWEVCVPNHKSDEYIEALADNHVDACIKMIEKLHELNLLQI